MKLRFNPHAIEWLLLLCFALCANVYGETCGPYSTGNFFCLSPNMSLTLPTVGSETGPGYAYDINNSLNLLDAHNHTPGYGALVPSAGLNINADLTFTNHSATALKACVYTAQSSFLTNDSTYVKGVDLYYRDGNSNEIRLTQSGGVAPNFPAEVANSVFAGPTSGGAAPSTFRALVNNDLPVVSLLKGGTGTAAASANAAFNALSPMTTLGDIIYGAGSGVATRLAGPITAATFVLTQTGTGAAGAAPIWLIGSATGSISNAVLRDANGNISSNSFFPSADSTVSAGSIVVISAANSPIQITTGATTETYRLPDATTLKIGAFYTFLNDSTGNVTVQNNSGGANIVVIPGGGRGTVFATNISTANGSWDARLEMPANASYGTTLATFPNILDSGLTASQAVVTDSSKNLTSLAFASANTASTLVERDGSGNFSANTITAGLVGNATNITGNLNFSHLTARDGAYYVSTGTASIGNSYATVPYATKVTDTNNNVSSSIFTASTAGWHQIYAMFTTNAVTWTTNDIVQILIQLNSATTLFNPFTQCTGNQNASSQAGGAYYLNVNDTVTVLARKIVSSATPTYSGVAGSNYFSVVYIGP